MSCPPNGKHHALQERLRNAAHASPDALPVRPEEMIILLDYIDELEETAYRAWEECMGEDL